MKYNYLTSIIISLIVIVISISTIILPKEVISEIEGRYLAKLPILLSDENDEPWYDNLLNGEYFVEWDNYLSDHIAGRDMFFSTYNNIQSSLGKKYINDVFFGEDNYLFSKVVYNDKSDEELRYRAEYFNELSQELPSSAFYMINLPNIDMLYSEKMPINGYNTSKEYDLKKLFSFLDDEITTLDMLDYYNSTESYYYKTDHHWNMNGTYLGYRSIINLLNDSFVDIGEPYSKTKFNIEVYPNYFVGSAGRKVSKLVPEVEDIEVWRLDGDENYKVYINDKEGSLFNYKKLNESLYNNDYGIYMGGDNGKEVIVNESINNDLTLVLFGDSMSNPLIPLLAAHFNVIYSYDMRHYKQPLLEELKIINPDIVLLIGLTPSFLTEGSEIFNIK